MIEKYVVSESDSLLHVLEVIEKNNSGFALVVADDKKLMGTLTDGDIRRYLIKNKTLEGRISEICPKSFEYLQVNSDLREVITKFKSRKVNFLPIVDSNGRLINLITKKNFQVMMLEDFNFDLASDFSAFDEKSIEHEIHDRPWGIYKSTMYSQHAQSKIITVFPMQSFSLQEHKLREEHWLVIKGEGYVVLGESKLPIYPGKYIYVPKGCKHKMMNSSATENLIFSEVQLGEYFGEDDIIRYDDQYGRI